jgi:(2Fe-2S) ferredoxin
VPRRYKLIVCRGPECGGKRHSADVHGALAQALGACPLPPGTEAVLDWHSCFGRCQRGPNVLVREIMPGENSFLVALMPQGAPGAVLYHAVRPNEAPRIVEEHVAGGRPIWEFCRRG